jgi:predicted DCC family thiol-disulfide oxidoreductase YuxK
MTRLVYDGDCGFCTTSAHWLESHGIDESVAVVPWQRIDLDSTGLTREQVTTAAYWLEDGRQYAGARAISKALQHCGQPWRLLGRLIDLPPVRPLARVGYRLVARYRYKLPGGTPACRL